MELLSRLQEQFGQLISLEEVEPHILRIYAPFFHEDGDMMSMYLDTTVGDNMFMVRDFGNTLMRVSYTFDIDTENKRNILDSIIKSNNGTLEDGELQLKANLDSLPEAIFRFSQLVAKVSSIDLLQRQVIKSMFFEYLNDFIVSKLSAFHVLQNYTPTKDKQLVVDYVINRDKCSKPIFIFGVNENVKASKTVISCLNFQKQHIPFRSLIIHEDFEGLSSFYRNQITNASDKQYTSFDDFREDGVDYISRELVS